MSMDKEIAQADVAIRPGTIVDLVCCKGAALTKAQTRAAYLARYLAGNVRLEHNGRVFLFDQYENMIELTIPEN